MSVSAGDHPGAVRGRTDGPPRTGVVVGVDGSPASARAVLWAADWAHQRNLPLRLVTAHPVAARSAAVHARVMTELRTLLIRAAAAAVARHPDLRIAMDVVRKSPAAALVGLAPEADLIVVGKRGSGGWSGLLLGSVAADVATHAECVVVVVPAAPDRAAAGTGSTGSTVVLGLDGGPESREAAEFAFRMARATDRSVTAVYVAPEAANVLTGPPVGPLNPSRRETGDGTEDLPPAVASTLEDCARRHPDVVVVRRTATGNPAIQLCRHAADAALLVVGSRGRGGFAGLLLGSTSRDLLQAAASPVAVVRPGDLAAPGDDRMQPDHAWGPVSPGVGA